MKQDMMMIRPTELSEASSSSDVLEVVLAAICCLFLFINVLRILTGCTFSPDSRSAGSPVFY